MNQNSKDDSLTQIIIRIMGDNKPRSLRQLINLTKEETSIPEQKVVECVLLLQSRGKITLKELPVRSPEKLGTYLKTKEAHWYWSILILVVATTSVVLTFPENFFPLVYLRYVLGVIFVLWLPGYAFIRALFPNLPSPKDSQKSLDSIERTALSIGTSLALVPIIGFILNYTPWGIRLVPITLSLLSLTVIFATVALKREHGHKIREET